MDAYCNLRAIKRLGVDISSNDFDYIALLLFGVALLKRCDIESKIALRKFRKL